jgi:hypothetical protein
MIEEPNVKDWLTTRGIPVRDAQSIMAQVPKEYPSLGRVLGANLRAKLEVVELIYHVQRGRFPPRGVKKEV